MRGAYKELMTLTMVLVGLYLVLVHYTGFSRSVASVGSAYAGGVKALQGRG
jgi:hypothetical protein